MNPIINANPTLIPFETKNAFLDSASNGKAPWPSCTMQLARNIPNGKSPFANNIRKIKCGPDCGMRPIKIAINKTMNGFESIRFWMLTKLFNIVRHNITPKVHRNIFGR